MEGLNEQRGRIEAILKELTIVPNTKDDLEELRRSIVRALATYLNQALGLQKTATSEKNESINKDIEELKERCMRAEKEIGQLIEQLNQPVAPQTETTREDLAQPGISAMDNIIEDLAKQPQADTSAATLTTLLQEIANQYKDILAGKYPKPDEQEPMLGATQKPIPKEIKVTHKPNGSNDTPTVTSITMDTADETLQCHAEPKIELPTKKNPDTVQQPTVELKLDRIKLPTFNGDLTKWITFRDQFLDLVHNNPKFTDITKFIALQNNLTGTAQEAIQGVRVTAANYETAWHILRRRYDNKDRLVDEYLNRLDQLPVLTAPTTYALINMVNYTKQILRVFPTLGIEVSHWDAIIKFTLLKKLDRQTHKKWLNQIKLR